MVAKKTFLTPLNHQQQPGLLTQGRLGPWFQAVDAKFSPNICWLSSNKVYICPVWAAFGWKELDLKVVVNFTMLLHLGTVLKSGSVKRLAVLL